MSAMLLVKISLLLLLLSVSPLPFSCAGRSNFMEKPSEETSSEFLRMRHGEFHERLLRINTKDYGTYDPAPTLHKPPFKLIPN